MLTQNMLVGKKIQLTSVRKDDLKTISRWSENTHFFRLFDAIAAYPKLPKKWQDWLIDTPQEDNTQFTFAVRRLGKSKIIGFVELEGILWNQQTGWLAIAIGSEKHRGKEFGREAMALILRYGFHELNLHRIQLSVFDYNPGAIQLYESLGFVLEGTYREALFRDGKRYNMHLYGLLRREWEKKNMNEE